jgi:hypothetical protein
MIKFLRNWLCKKELKEIEDLKNKYIAMSNENFNKGYGKAYAEILSSIRACPTEFRVFVDKLEHMETKDLLELCEKIVKKDAK